MRNDQFHIRKADLTAGVYYAGNCRNASYARWNGRVFIHWRTKFKMRFLEEIKCPEDDDQFDVFYATHRIPDPRFVDEMLPLEITEATRP